MSNHVLSNLFKTRLSKAVLSVVLAAVLLVAAAGSYRPASAHCDSANGPVVQAALAALDTGNVKLVLPYIQPDSEAELTAAFKHSLEVRKLGPDAKKLANEYFSETAVRLHRTGEGAAYTGVTNEPVPPAIVEADKAMQSGNLNAVNTLLADALKKGVAEKYQAVVAAREDAKKLNTVEAQRERVEAELTFEKYVYEAYTFASQGAVVSETGAATGTAAAGGHTH